MQKLTKPIAFILALVIITVPSLSCAEGASSMTKDAVTKVFPNMTVGDIRETDITGLYEITAGENIVYFYPEKNLLVFGEIWTKEGKNLTAKRKDEIFAKKLKDVPLDKALKIGEGKNTVILFTDPDCPYCRKVSQYLKEKANIAQYVFFSPLPSHKDAEGKIMHVLCARDKQKAYEDVMKGIFDKQQPTACTDEKASGLLKEHKAISQKLGITGTPMLWVNSNMVKGANIPLIEKYLDKN